jgi:hypothetical protein
LSCLKEFDQTACVIVKHANPCGVAIGDELTDVYTRAFNTDSLSAFGGIIALLCGYSLGKLAIAFPSRGGIIEYLVQSYGKGFFSGSLGILFYLAQLVALAAVAKSFGTYAATFMSS